MAVDRRARGHAVEALLARQAFEEAPLAGLIPTPNGPATEPRRPASAAVQSATSPLATPPGPMPPPARTVPRIAWVPLTVLLCLAVFVLLWLAMPLGFFSLANGKLPTYILPCLLPIALLLGNALADRLRLEQGRALSINGLLNLALGIVLLIALTGRYPSALTILA